MEQILIFAVARKLVIASSVLRGMLKITVTSCHYDPLRYKVQGTDYGLTVPIYESSQRNDSRPR